MEATLRRKKPKSEEVIGNIDTAICEIPDPHKIEIEDPLLNVLPTDTENIVKDDYVNDKVIEDKTIEQIKDEYNIDAIKDAFDDGQVLIKFFLVGKIRALWMPATFYDLAKSKMSLCLFCIYESLFVEIADTLIQYIKNLSSDEIDQIDEDTRSNWWGL